MPDPSGDRKGQPTFPDMSQPIFNERKYGRKELGRDRACKKLSKERERDVSDFLESVILALAEGDKLPSHEAQMESRVFLINSIASKLDSRTLRSLRARRQARSKSISVGVRKRYIPIMFVLGQKLFTRQNLHTGADIAVKALGRTGANKLSQAVIMYLTTAIFSQDKVHPINNPLSSGTSSIGMNNVLCQATSLGDSISNSRTAETDYFFGLSPHQAPTSTSEIVSTITEIPCTCCIQ
jgi:hypothetical protein